MKASDLILELQRHIDEYGDIEVFRTFGERTVEVFQAEVTDMCEDDGNWMRCDYDLCSRPHQTGVIIR